MGGPMQETLPVAIAKYSWADEGKFVCVYISAEGEAAAVATAGDGKGGEVDAKFEERCVELKIGTGGKVFALTLKELEGRIIPDESSCRVSAGKRITIKLKKQAIATWTRLLRPHR